METDNQKISQAKPQFGLIDLAAKIVAAYVSNNPVPQAELPQLIRDVHQSLDQLAATPAAEVRPAAKPAVPVRKSIFDDYLICLEDGKKFKSLRRHLRSHYDMSPEEYREKWNLPSDYPMVAPNYAKTRSRLAKQIGLGQGKK